MASFPAFAPRLLTRSAFTALLVLGYAAAHAQIMPQPAPPMGPAPTNVSYYVDGKKISPLEMAAIKSDDILSMDVIKDKAEQRSLGEAQAEGVVLITTKAHASLPAVQAFNKRFPVQPGIPAQNEAAAAAQAYLKQHYPAAKLESILSVKGKTDRYNATFTNEGQRLQLLFDGKGNPVEQ
ncbi:hypothetical protein HHL22_17080 [Hymenobacter sp. RP-2-7]|uniref:Beta-lactamase-inhibitor-like PepSY-like domain-containing protein n=1 Tax=Hymenobacter polaris TaxID=2682546 RepID=A0A7Y0AGJ3_9BACT|nr:hypothetical protein [Hymenobacter polaris]NML66922.1 hypothetical protein [Hymenobacter polaris]